jgi:hypothetical protein
MICTRAIGEARGFFASHSSSARKIMIYPYPRRMGSYRRHHPQDMSIAVAIYPTAAFKESLKSPPLERDHDQARTLKPLTRPVRPRNEQRSNDKRQTPAHASSSRPSRAWEHWQHEMWELFGEGELETVSIGRRRFVVVESLDAYIARLRARAAERGAGHSKRRCAARKQRGPPPHMRAATLG